MGMAVGTTKPAGLLVGRIPGEKGRCRGLDLRHCVGSVPSFPSDSVLCSPRYPCTWPELGRD